MSRVCYEVEMCLLGYASDHRSCGAVVAEDPETVTVCRRCSALLGLSVKEVFDAHVQNISEGLEVVVGDGASTSEEVGDDAGVDPGRGGELLDAPPLFDHVLSEGGVGGERSAHDDTLSPRAPEVLE